MNAGAAGPELAVFETSNHHWVWRCDRCRISPSFRMADSAEEYLRRHLRDPKHWGIADPGAEFLQRVAERANRTNGGGGLVNFASAEVDRYDGALSSVVEAVLAEIDR